MAAPTTRRARHRRAIGLFLIGAGVVGLLGAVIVSLPPVQRSIFLTLLASPDLDRVEVGRVRFRPGSFRVEDLVVERAGVRSALTGVRGEGSIWKALLGRPVGLRLYEVEGWVLQMDGESLRAAADGGMAVESVLALLPLALKVDLLRLEARMEIEVEPDRLMSVDLTGEGADLGPGRVGRIGLAGKVQGPASPDQPLRLDVTLARGADAASDEIGVEGMLGEGTGAVVLTLVARRDEAVLKVEGAVEADLPALEGLAGGDGVPRFASGTGRLSFALRSNFAGEAIVEGALTAEGVESAGGYRIDRVSVPYRLILIPDTSFSLRAPAVIVRGERVSDLQVTVSAVADAPGWRTAGSLSGEEILVDDLAVLALLFRESTAAAAADPVPAWGDLRGALDLDFGRVWLGEAIAMEGLQAQVRFEADGVVIEEAEAGLAGGALTGGLRLGFDPSAEQPYRLESRCTADGVEISRLLQRGRDGNAVLDGPFALELSLAASGVRLRGLGSGLTGQWAVLGGPGEFRGFREQTRSASSVAGLLGAFLKSDRLQALAGLAQELGVIRYEQIRMDVERDAAGRLTVGRLQLQGPGIKLAGEGWVGASPWDGYGQAPMSLTFRMGAKGTLADLLGEVGLAELGRIDAEGYRLMNRSFTVGGSPMAPDVSDLWGILREAATGALFGGGR